MSESVERTAVIVTGASGAIGQAIAKRCNEAGIFVIGLDRCAPPVNTQCHLECDLAAFVNCAEYREAKVSAIERALNGYQLVGLVNNAAVQLTGSLREMEIDAFKQMFDVNLHAPFLLSKAVLDYFVEGAGVIINIGSIHSRLTKPGFVGYAASKAALEGLTKAMAVDVGNTVRVNCILPAAINTPMLREGFNNNEEAIDALRRYHPSCSIGEPGDVAELVIFLLGSNTKFLNGSLIDLSGAISSRLHDPE